MEKFKQIGIDIVVHRIIEGQRRSFAESENDILRRLLSGDASMISSVTPEVQREGSGDRIRGRWTVKFCEERIPAPNLKAAYKVLLSCLSDRYPDFLSAFAREGGSSRKFIGRSPSEIYLSSPALKDFAQPLRDGWLFDSNLSTDQVARRARVAARLCGLRYGHDVAILNGLEEI